MSFLGDILRRKCLESAKKYRTPGAWRVSAENSSYYLAKRMGWLPELTSHMRHHKITATIEVIKEWCSKNGIKSVASYLEASQDNRLPVGFPRNIGAWGPYRKSDLFTETRPKEAVKFEEFSLWCVKNEVYSLKDYYSLWKNGKTPQNFPGYPRDAYSRDQFLSLPFKHKRNIMDRRIELGEVTTFCKENGITTATEYQNARKRGELPSGFPQALYTVYDGNLGSFFKEHPKTRDKLNREIAVFCKENHISSVTEYKEWFDAGKLPSHFIKKLEHRFKGSDYGGELDFLRHRLAGVAVRVTDTSNNKAVVYNSIYSALSSLRVGNERIKKCAESGEPLVKNGNTYKVEWA